MVKVLVVAGWDRSGSTVLSEVLGSADHVVSVGEVNNLWERGFALDHRCGCGLRFSECELWSDVTAKAFGGDRAAALDRARRASEGLGNGWLLLSRLPFVGRRLARRGDSYADLLGEVYRAIAEVSGARLIVDSSKTPWHAALAARAPGAEVSVVHLVRDPRGVVNSLRKHVLYEKDPERDTYMDRHSAAFATAAWSFRTWLIDRMWRSSPAFASVRYEDFVAAPEATVTAVLRLAGEPDLTAAFSAPDVVDVPSSHSVSGNPVRFRNGPLRLVTDEAWRSTLPPATVRLVNLLAGPLLARYRYRRSTSFVKGDRP